MKIRNSSNERIRLEDVALVHESQRFAMAKAVDSSDIRDRTEKVGFILTHRMASGLDSGDQFFVRNVGAETRRSESRPSFSFSLATNF